MVLKILLQPWKSSPKISLALLSSFLFFFLCSFMNLFVRSSSYLWHRGHRVLRAQLFSTNASTSSFSSSSSAPIDSMQHRIWRAGDPSVSIVPILEQWLEQGKDVKLFELQKLIKQLRKYRRFTHALQLSEWMMEQRVYNFSAGDVAIRLDLISKVLGLKAAEEYFKSISVRSRGYQVYGALLSCYAHAKQLEKAEGMMKEMKDMGFIKTALSYNTMLNLYSQMGKHEKLDILMQEMEKRGIKYDMFTFNIRLHAYVTTSDIEGMEKLLTKMEKDPQIKMDFHAYVVAANGYLKAGLTDKTLMMLNRSEQLIRDNSRRFAYEMLLTLYTAIGNKAEVYRVWNLYKEMDRFFNSSYICMISSLVKLDDIDGAEKIWEEWDSRRVVFDIRIPNLMISAFSRKGFWEKAEEYINKIVERGKEPDATSWDHLAAGYVLGGQMMKAVETIKKAISTSERCKPRPRTLAACLRYLKDQGDKEAAKELFKMINEHCHFSTDAYNIFSSCINDESLTNTSALNQIEDDNQMFGETPTVLELSDKETA